MKGFEQQTADTIRTLTGVVVVVAVAVTVALGFAVIGFVRITNDEQRTCQIQARGLPAGHELTAVQNDFYKLLTLKPTTKAERLAVAHEPRRVRLIVKDMTAHLRLYRALEAAQPHGRSC